MKSAYVLAAVGIAASSVVGCTTAERGAAGGAVAGAAIGAAVSGDVEGAAIGAAVGGASGYLLGRLANGDCRYRAADGSTYIARCP